MSSVMNMNFDIGFPILSIISLTSFLYLDSQLTNLEIKFER